MKKPSGSTIYRVTVPAEIAKQIEEVDLVPELTDQGLLFRPATPEELAPAQPPEWALLGKEAKEVIFEPVLDPPATPPELARKRPRQGASRPPSGE